MQDAFKITYLCKGNEIELKSRDFILHEVITAQGPDKRDDFDTRMKEKAPEELTRKEKTAWRRKHVDTVVTEFDKWMQPLQQRVEAELKLQPNFSITGQEGHCCFEGSVTLTVYSCPECGKFHSTELH